MIIRTQSSPNDSKQFYTRTYLQSYVVCTRFIYVGTVSMFLELDPPNFAQTPPWRLSLACVPRPPPWEVCQYLLVVTTGSRQEFRLRPPLSRSAQPKYLDPPGGLVRGTFNCTYQVFDLTRVHAMGIFSFSILIPTPAIPDKPSHNLRSHIPSTLDPRPCVDTEQKLNRRVSRR